MADAVGITRSEVRRGGSPGQAEEIHAIALAAVDLDRHPGFAAFTTGAVTVDQVGAQHDALSADSRWAASAIRAALRRSGCAVEADRGNETTIVTVWAIGESNDDAQVDTKLVDERDEYGRMVLVLDGPDGAIEQQCGSGGHNDLIVHSRHPFAGSARIECPRHGAGCWIRSDWPWEKRTVRSCIRSIVTDAGYAWQVAPEAELRMRDIYVQHIQRTRHTGSGRAFRLPTPSATQRPSRVTPTRVPSPQPSASSSRQVDVIRDLADFRKA